MAFEPSIATAAEEAAEHATGMEAGENASAALAKRHRFESKFHLLPYLHCYFHYFLLVSNSCLVKPSRTTVVESEEEEDEDPGDGGGDDDDDGDDDMDNIPLSVRLQTIGAQLPSSAGDPTARDIPIVNVPDSSGETRGADLVPPHAEPVLYQLPEPESSAVI